VWYFFIGKQKVVLFPKYRENGWESAASALTPYSYCTFPRDSCKYRASVVEGFFGVFHEIFHKHREENQYRETATSTLTYIDAVWLSGITKTMLWELEMRSDTLTIFV
jgi:hypothetical protein